MADRLKIECVSPTGEVKVYDVGPAGLSVGRASTNDLAIPDEMLSRKHCLFQPSGETGLKVTDLASANGTFVNGEQVGASDVELHAGDVVTAGDQRFSIRGAGAPPVKAGSVDLGLGASPASDGAEAAAPAHGSPLRIALWAVALVVAVLAVMLVMLVDVPAAEPVVISQPAEEKDADGISSVEFEKVDADSKGIYRYAIAYDGFSGELSVQYHDLPVNNRQLQKKTKLSPKAVGVLREICGGAAGFFTLDREYSGADPLELNSLKSRRIRIVRGRKVTCVTVVNVEEPAEFRSLREALEAFSRNELGTWAIEYSRDKLIELSHQRAETAKQKYDEREVDYGNLFASVKAYREAVFYLETVDPKPEGYPDILERLEVSSKALDESYREMRFQADKALNMQDWEVAADRLKILCLIVPDKDDDRNREAKATLVDVEKRLRKGGGK